MVGGSRRGIGNRKNLDQTFWLKSVYYLFLQALSVVTECKKAFYYINPLSLFNFSALDRSSSSGKFYMFVFFFSSAILKTCINVHQSLPENQRSLTIGVLFWKRQKRGLITHVASF